MDKWLMSILWRMRGIEMHFDTNIGKWLSSLSSALTAFAGDFDVADLSSVADAEDDESDPFMGEDNEGYDDTDAPQGIHKYEKLKDRSFNEDQYQSLERQLWRQTKRVSELRYVKSCSENVLMNASI